MSPSRHGTAFGGNEIYQLKVCVRPRTRCRTKNQRKRSRLIKTLPLSSSAVHCAIPSSERQKVCTLAREMEAVYSSSSLPWHRGMPDPLNFGNGDVFQLTWNVAFEYERQRLTGCDTLRVYRRPKLPNMDMRPRLPLYQSIYYTFNHLASLLAL